MTEPDFERVCGVAIKTDDDGSIYAEIYGPEGMSYASLKDIRLIAAMLEDAEKSRAEEIGA